MPELREKVSFCKLHFGIACEINLSMGQRLMHAATVVYCQAKSNFPKIRVHQQTTTATTATRIRGWVKFREIVFLSIIKLYFIAASPNVNANVCVLQERGAKDSETVAGLRLCRR